MIPLLLLLVAAGDDATSATAWGYPFGGDGWGYPITRRFGELEARGRRHAGLDVAAPCGTPVLALAAGEVVTAPQHDPREPTGKRLVLRHRLADGTFVVSEYAHLMSVPPLPREVAAGTPIGRVGARTTGHACHLHLALRRALAPDGGSTSGDPARDGYLDPEAWLRRNTGG